MRAMRGTMAKLVFVVLLACTVVPTAGAVVGDDGGFIPNQGLAGTCKYASLEYSEGACRGGQRCSSSGTWYDDPSCGS